MISQPSPSSEDLPARPATNGAGTAADERLVTRSCALTRTMLADGEIVILELKPSAWFVPLVSAPMAAVGVLLLLVGETAMVDQSLPGLHPWLHYAGIWVIVLRVIWAVLQWSCRLYVLTDRRVIRQGGVLTVQVFECRLDRLQNTFIQRTLVQRFLGIGNIYFATAGTASIEAVWQHVRRPGDVHRQIIEAANRFQRLMRGNNGL